MEFDFYKTKGVKWRVPVDRSWRGVSPICPNDNLDLSLIRNNYNDCHFKCPECNKEYTFPFEHTELQTYIINKLKSIILKNTKFINLDNEIIPISESKDKSDDEKYFVIAKLVRAKNGLSLVVYAGEQGSNDKTQLFIEPEINRLSFDPDNINPSDIFVKLEAKFRNGSTHTINNSKSSS